MKANLKWVILLTFTLSGWISKAQDAMQLTFTVAANDSIVIPVNSGHIYNYNVDWNDGSNSSGITGDAKHVYTLAGSYTISISGQFPQINFGNNTAQNADKLTSIDQWGDQVWASMDSAFMNCGNMNLLAIDTPNLSMVKDMSYMFNECESMNGPVNHWDVSNVEYMDWLFAYGEVFNQPLNNWDVSNVQSMEDMFYYCYVFNQPLNNWNVSRVKNMRYLFEDAEVFNQDISSWVVDSVTDMFGMFAGALDFNQNISGWNVSNVTNMSNMFASAIDFNQPIGIWDVSNVTGMSRMFRNARSFNMPIDNWDVSKVTVMNNMFEYAEDFDQPIGSWDVSNVTTMSYMFWKASDFNQDISNWDVGKVKEMKMMFREASSFNQPIGKWDMSSAEELWEMLYEASSFDQNLGGWDISRIQPGGSGLSRILRNSKISTANYDATLMGWARLDPGDSIVPTGIWLDAGASAYCQSNAVRDSLINNYNWQIVDAGLSCSESAYFITKWHTTSPNEVINFTVGNGTFLYEIDWNYNGTFSADSTFVTGDIDITFASADTHKIAVRGAFPHINFENSSTPDNLVSVEQWGDQIWTSMYYAFGECENMQILAVDTPNLSCVEDLGYMFYNCAAMNQDISTWDVSHVKSLYYTFHYAETFNQDIGNWDVSNVTDFEGTFASAYRFNQDISSWKVDSAKSMYEMFDDATDFNQDIGGWNVSNVENMNDMFSYASKFNQDISSWDVSNVTDMRGMFERTDSFNQNINGWTVSMVDDMSDMFHDAISFNQPLNNWNVGNVETMNSMFKEAAAFDQVISGWNVSKVKNMRNMFDEATSFNQDLSSWDVSNVTQMTYMFSNATSFNQPLGSWDISSVITGFNGMYQMLYQSGLSVENYDSTLMGWARLDAGEPHVPTNLRLGAYPLQYCAGEDARDSLTNNYGWNITDDGSAGSSCQQIVNNCPITNTFKFDQVSYNIRKHGVFVVGTYYHGLSRAMGVKVNTTNGSGNYSYEWSSKEGYTIKNSTSQKARLWYPTGSTWLKVKVTDLGNNCSKTDSVFIDWTDEYTCNPPGMIWYYQLCKNGSQTVCVHTWWNMVDSLATGNYTFGNCSGPQPAMSNGNSLDEISMNIFPNPAEATDEISFTIDLEMINKYHLALTNINGRVIHTSEEMNNDDHMIEGHLNIPRLSPGVYILKITTLNNTVTKRLLIR